MADNCVIDVFEITANIATTVGIPIAIGALIIAYKQYAAELDQEKREREYRTFDELDNKYIEFMYACAQYPHLDLFSTPLSQSNRNISEQDIVIERVLFSILISIFERVVLMYHHQTDEKQEIYKNQYDGWVKCIRSYCTRKQFLLEWGAIGKQFDTIFQNKMNELINEERLKTQDV